MNFASFDFLYFLLIACPVYWALAPHKRSQDLFLLAISYFFYACWDVRFLALIVAVTASSFWAERAISSEHDPAQRKRWLLCFLGFVLGILAFFKYFNFFVDTAVAVVRFAGMDVQVRHLNIILPAAISFYVFESISYVMGGYSRSNQCKANWVEYSLFIAFFPKLVAGPIERPNNLIPQLNAPRQMSWAALSDGSYLVLLGLFKKIALADGLAPMVSSVFEAPGQPSALDVVAATLAFTFQIYCDFSGYSDIARGVARWFGIHLSLNFNVPYSSLNPSEFWRRWHISLSSWLRDYVYIPLGGNRQGEGMARRNQFLTMLIGGLWHGAAWTFILWGAYQGALLAVHRLLQPVLSRLRGPQYSVTRSFAYTMLAWSVFMVLTAYGWLIFRANSLQQVLDMTRALFTGGWTTVVSAPPLSVMAGLPLLMGIDTVHRLRGGEAGRAAIHWSVRSFAYASMVFVIFLGLANARSSFIYFQF